VCYIFKPDATIPSYAEYLTTVTIVESQKFVNLFNTNTAEQSYCSQTVLKVEYYTIYQSATCI